MDVFFFFICALQRNSVGPTVLLCPTSTKSQENNHISNLYFWFTLAPHRKLTLTKQKAKSLYASISSWDQASDAEKNSPLPRRDQLCLRRQREAYVDPLWFCLKTDVDWEWVVERSSWLSLPAVAHLQLPERLPSFLLVLWVAGFGKLFCAIGWVAIWRGMMSWIGVAHWRMLPEVVQRRGGRWGHVLRRATLRFDVEVEGRQMRRGWSAGLRGERASPAGPSENNKRVEEMNLDWNTSSVLELQLRGTRSSLKII